MKRKRLTRFLSLTVLSLATALIIASPAWASTLVYVMPHCTCCDKYVKYLQKNGFDVSAKTMPQGDRLAHEYGVPKTFAICHFMKIGGYVVVGHVPAEVVRRLLSERPHILGIALPGMPAGSPGMMGKKKGPFVIYAFDKRGKYWVYAKV